MQVDFSAEAGGSQREGWMEKLSKVRKNWNKRYFVISDGTLKYFTVGPGEPHFASSQKGTIALFGSKLKIEQANVVNIYYPNVKKEVFEIRASSAQEAEDWVAAMRLETERLYVLALASGSRAPEVVEWYYHQQSQLEQRCEFLEQALTVDLHYDAPGGIGAISHSSFVVKMTSDRLGLLFSVAHAPTATTKKGGHSRAESLYNGRVVLFTDIMGAYLPQGSWEAPSSGVFPFTLLTKEDELSMEVSDAAAGVRWLRAVQSMVVFAQVPTPTSRTGMSPAAAAAIGTLASHSGSPPGVSSSSAAAAAGMIHSSGTGNVPGSLAQLQREASSPSTLSRGPSSIMEFSANSSSVFACSSDTHLILQNLTTGSVAQKSALIPDVAKSLSSIMKAIPDMKCNREAAARFGERLEEVTRALGDSEVGILHCATVADKTLLTFHLSTLQKLLDELLKFLKVQSQLGWLAWNVDENSQTIRTIFESLDADIISVVNILANALELQEEGVRLRRKEYFMAVDVRASVQALGGARAIFEDKAKEKALARLIQADGFEVSAELTDMFLADFDDSETISEGGGGDGEGGANGGAGGGCGVDSSGRESRHSRASRVSRSSRRSRHSAAAEDPRRSSVSLDESRFSMRKPSRFRRLLRYVCCSGCCAPSPKAYTSGSSGGEKSSEIMGKYGGKKKRARGKIQLKEPLMEA